MNKNKRVRNTGKKKAVSRSRFNYPETLTLKEVQKKLFTERYKLDDLLSNIRQKGTETAVDDFIDSLVGYSEASKKNVCKQLKRILRFKANQLPVQPIARVFAPELLDWMIDPLKLGRRSGGVRVLQPDPPDTWV